MSEIVKAYYNEGAKYEFERLNNHYSIIEFKSTLFLIEKYFPKQGHILDIGSGPGRYSLELLKRGYEVTLSDISDQSIELAKENIKHAGLEAQGYICASATELDHLQENTYDALLVLGPMYHLHDQPDREKVLNTVKSILKPGGHAIISYINSYGILRSTLTESPEEFNPRTFDETYVKGNWKLNDEECFTEAFFTTPKLALEEVKASGLEVVSYAGAESFLSGLHLPLKAIKENNESIYQDYVASASTHCELEHYRDTTEHLLIIVKNIG